MVSNMHKGCLTITVMSLFIGQMRAMSEEIPSLTNHLKNINIVGKPAPIHRVPAYLYARGVHIGKYLEEAPTLQNFIKLLHSNDIDQQVRDEFRGNALALAALEMILLRKNFKELTVEDVNKLHALLMKDVTSLEGTPVSRLDQKEGFRGVCRTSDEVICNHTDENVFRRFVVTDNVVAKLKALSAQRKISMSEALHLLPKAEQDKINRYMSIMPSHETIKDKMQSLVQTIQEKADDADPLEMAALVHQRMVKLHPYPDGNGRIARLLANYILMKRGMHPVYFIKKENYLNAVRQDEAQFTTFIAEQENMILSMVRAFTGFKDSVTQTNPAFDSLSGLPINFPVSSEEHAVYSSLFNNIECDKPDRLSPVLQDFENAVRATWCRTVKDLGNTSFCITCGKTAPHDTKFLQCGKCRVPFYCSKECQVENWRYHKSTCRGNNN